ncbi:MAG: GDYXXLXY domain-containing protein [Cyclobacteriaceae bacterium]
MKTKVSLIFLFLAFLAQWLVPGRMVWIHEQTIRLGESVKFKTASVDPFDLFRGKYVELGYRNMTIETTPQENWKPGEKVFVLLEKDAQGYAKAKGLSRKRPEGKLYFQTILRSESTFKGRSNIDVDIPFSRYYADEFDAPLIEKTTLNFSDTLIYAWADVRLYQGKAVLNQLYIGELTASDWVKKHNNEEP